MDPALFPTTPAVQADPTVGHLDICESFGLDHERQILAVACPANLPPDVQLFSFRDRETGVEFPAQRSLENPDQAFIQLELRAGDHHQLLAQNHFSAVTDAITFSERDHAGIVSNGKWGAEIFLGDWRADENSLPSFDTPGPIRRLRVKDGPWRGNCFFDTRHPVRAISCTVLESGPLRVVTQFKATIGQVFSYVARLTFDAGTDYIGIDEAFACGAGDQIVWDYSGNDLPQEIHLLDSTANFTTQGLHYFFDRRLARLACWNQYSQLHDFSDGYALTFPQSGDVIGYVALAGGDWDGNAHNFLEAWTRRWFPGDPASRRLVPPEAKADGAPSPERVPARPANLCEPHFSVEGWLHRGRRRTALVLASKDSLRPAEWNASPPLGHFETKVDRARYCQQQGLLRRIHTQRGMLPLADQLSLCSNWPPDALSPERINSDAPWDNPDLIHPQHDPPLTIPDRVGQLLEFLAARVFGFWEGSGSAFTNAVVSRRLAHDLIDWEWLAAHGHFTSTQFQQSRAWFVLLSRLFSSDHYYPGAASMNLGDPNCRLEPTIAGMANQNFFTDVFNMPGVAAQVFPSHPDAAFWRDRFTQMWRRQLEYHVYPESGLWEESHTYFHHVLHTVIPTLERRRDDGVEDGFSSPAFQHLVQSLLKMLSPRDASFRGLRHVVALGDHGVDLHNLYRPLYRILARYIAPSHPELASRLAWAYREMGGEHALEVQPQPISWRNEYVQGLGYFFRAEDSRGESLMVLRCGNAWAHHHNDDGSLQYFYAGRPWIVDSAHSYPQEKGVRKFRADGHSRWAPRDLDPLNYLWQFNRGWISHHQQDGAFPYAVAFTPIYMAEASWQQYTALRVPLLHWRCVIQLAAGAFLILDRSDARNPQVIRFHVPVDAPLALEDAAPPAGEKGNYLRLRSLLGLNPPHAGVADRPTEAPETFTTREIQYGLNRAPLAACLILVEDALSSSTLSVKSGEGRLRVENAEFAAELLVDSSGAATLLNSRTGARSIIPWNDTSRP